MLWRTPWLAPRILWLGMACFDALTIFVSYSVNYWNSYNTLPAIRGSILTAIATWVSLSYLAGRYSSSPIDRGQSLLQIANKTLLVSGIILAATALMSWGAEVKDPRTFRSFAVPTITLVTATSIAIQTVARSQTWNCQKWLFITSKREEQLIKADLKEGTIQSCADYRFVSDSNFKTGLKHQELKEYTNIILGEDEALKEEDLQRLLKLRSAGTQVQGIIPWAEAALQRVPAELFNSQWLIRAEGFEIGPDTLSWRVKRYGDLFVALVLVVVTLPIMAITAFLIKLEDGGPILFKQIRTGIYGQSFTITKFRSMRTNAESLGVQWASKDDPRTTRIGSLIRKLRIDELPQLLSVLKGDMSLVGPRPERPEIEQRLEEMIPHYRIRHWIRPGLSGWAQVCYPYGASVNDSRNKLSFDIYYIRNYSIALDLLIFVKTIQLVFRGAGSEPKKVQNLSRW